MRGLWKVVPVAYHQYVLIALAVFTLILLLIAKFSSRWVQDLLIFNYLLLKRPPYWLPIDTTWPSVDIQLLLQQKCCPLSGPLVTLIWELVSTNTLTMPKRMRGTSKTVRSVHTEQTYDHTVHTEQTYVDSVAMCAV